MSTGLRHLEPARVNDGGLLAVLDSTRAGASGLKSLDDAQGLGVGNLAEDDVAAIEPRGLDGGDEELGAVAVQEYVSRARDGRYRSKCVVECSLRVGAGVGHGEETGAVVLSGEVLVGELLAVDGLATSALEQRVSTLEASRARKKKLSWWTEGPGEWVILRSRLTLPRVKSPPWSMKSGMMRWKEDPL